MHRHRSPTPTLHYPCAAKGLRPQPSVADRAQRHGYGSAGMMNRAFFFLTPIGPPNDLRDTCATAQIGTCGTRWVESPLIPTCNSSPSGTSPPHITYHRHPPREAGSGVPPLTAPPAAR
ncbi:hypothetical protein GCM10020218_070840 [Dactylosporangium vinaceum]